MEYVLFRKKKDDEGWKITTKGDRYYIIEVLKINLDSPSLKDYSYRIEPII